MIGRSKPRLSGFARVYLFVDACRNQWSAAGNSVNAALKMAADKLSTALTAVAGSGQMFVLLGTKPGAYSTEDDRFADRTYCRLANGRISRFLHMERRTLCRTEIT